VVELMGYKRAQGERIPHDVERDTLGIDEQMLPAALLRATRYTECLIQANGWRDGAFKEWVLYPGMLFRAPTQWWGDRAKRKTPHEGLDLCFYRDKEDRMLSLDGDTQIPAMVDGVVVGMIGDFLGTSVIVRHCIPGNDAAAFYTMYGHTDPGSEMRTGRMVRRGETIARVAHMRSARSQVRAHLHISIGLASRLLSDEELDWAAIGDPDTMTLVDPLPAIDRVCVLSEAVSSEVTLY
jgi:peptidase M23-like protein